LKMTRGAKCGLSCDWQESGEDPKLSTFSIHSVACDKDLIFFFMPQRPPNHVGQYRCDHARARAGAGAGRSRAALVLVGRHTAAD
jgi:hypothetical protein